MQRTSNSLILLCGVLMLAAIASLLFMTENPFSLDDGLRHLIMAEYYLAHGIQSAQGWGRFFFVGYMAQNTFDPWFLADIAYVPFTVFASRIIGLKAATIAFLGVLLLSVLLFLRRYRVPTYLSVFALCLLFFGNSVFAFRMLLGRPFILMSALFLLAYFFIAERRWVLLSITVLVGTLISHLFVFLLFLCFFASGWMILQAYFASDFPEQRQWIRSSVYCVFFSSLGCAAGVLLHPHSGDYLRYLRDVFFRIPFSKSIGIGGEFYSGITNGDTTLFFAVCLLLFFFFSALRCGALRFMVHKRPELLLTLLLSLFFFAAYLLWSRAIDFLWPLLLILFLQFASGIKDLPRQMRAEMLTIIPHPLERLGCIVLLAFCMVNYLSLAASVRFFNPPRSPQVFSAISTVPEGSRVLNIDWDVFPVLLHLNDSVLYARGMDPTFDYVADPESFALLDLPNEWWSWDWGNIPESWKEFRERFDFSKMKLTTFEETEIDVAGWVDDLRYAFAPTHFAVAKERHADLLDKLKEVLTVYAESEGLVVFTM